MPGEAFFNGGAGKKEKFPEGLRVHFNIIHPPPKNPPLTEEKRRGGNRARPPKDRLSFSETKTRDPLIMPDVICTASMRVSFVNCNDTVCEWRIGGVCVLYPNTNALVHSRKTLSLSLSCHISRSSTTVAVSRRILCIHPPAFVYRRVVVWRDLPFEIRGRGLLSLSLFPFNCISLCVHAAVIALTVHQTHTCRLTC